MNLIANTSADKAAQLSQQIGGLLKPYLDMVKEVVERQAEIPAVQQRQTMFTNRRFGR